MCLKIVINSCEIWECFCWISRRTRFLANRFNHFETDREIKLCSEVKVKALISCFFDISNKSSMINRRTHVDALLISFMTIEKWSKTWVRLKYFSVESKYIMLQLFSSRKWKQSSKAYVMIMLLAYALKTVCRYRILSFSELASLHCKSIFFKQFLIINSTLRMLTLKKNSLMLFQCIWCTSWSIVTMIEFETDESKS